MDENLLQLKGEGKKKEIVFRASSAVYLVKRKTVVPQIGQVPLIALLPFLRVTTSGFFGTTFFLHFTQKASWAAMACR